MSSEDGLLKCGDTEFCDECKTWAKEDGVPEGPRCLHPNDKGRCDFYTGPSDDIVKVDARR